MLKLRVVEFVFFRLNWVKISSLEFEYFDIEGG